ncbi:hypothetical protein GQ600_9032 [Phytophthora cactorum]|nr:hypothetical protein GQ600_9032 [Phytophthora cactorum]
MAACIRPEHTARAGATPEIFL